MVLIVLSLDLQDAYHVVTLIYAIFPAHILKQEDVKFTFKIAVSAASRGSGFSTRNTYLAYRVTPVRLLELSTNNI
jgi:hypothetical protein